MYANLKQRMNQAALAGAVHVLYADSHAQGFTPFVLQGSIDWAIEEGDSICGVQAAVEFFGSPVVAAAFAALLPAG